ncbi:MAG: Transcriptional regulatory protein SrrA [Alphaproteobacteria bacterium ADurb.Bin438]|nr:MAG: Transcriptional regulatory protein SrrA [Alphaproteobacteria bacterium ADurb.Bin438]
MKQNKILIVDDEAKIREVLRDYLEAIGYDVYEACNGEQGVKKFEEVYPNLVLLDLMLPDINGEEVCQRIRRKSRIPIIMLTAKASEENLLDGFGYGADDYITKPFSLKEISVRIKAVLRRVETDELSEKPVSFLDGYLVIDYNTRFVQKEGEEVCLTPTEFNILSTLAKSPYKAFSREQLINFALNDDFYGYDRTIDTYIKTIRQKIEPNPKKPKLITTVYGYGYRFEGE